MQPKARGTANRISERKRNVLPGGERGRKRDYHRWWANPDTRVYSCLFGRRLLSTKVYHQEGMQLTIFTESLKLPLSWNPDKESHLLCLQLLLLLPSSGAVSMSPSPQSGRLYLSTVPHTCGTSCPCDAGAGLCAPSHRTLARTLCLVYRKCRPGQDKSITPVISPASSLRMVKSQTLLSEEKHFFGGMNWKQKGSSGIRC